MRHIASLLAVTFFSLLILKGQGDTNSVITSTDSAISTPMTMETVINQRKADSTAQAELEGQLGALDALSQDETRKLEARLDSVLRVRALRKDRARSLVDSLRKNRQPVPVLFFEDTLFNVYAKLGPLSPAERAAVITKKMEELADDEMADPYKIRLVVSEETSDVMYEDIILLSVSDMDAEYLNETQAALAEKYLEIVKQALQKHQESTGWIYTLLRVLLLIGLVVGFYFGIRYLNLALTSLSTKVIRKIGPRLKGIRLKTYEFMTAKQELRLIGWFVNITKWTIIVLTVYLTLPIIFSIFPATKGIATALFSYILTPLKAFFTGFLNYIPHLVTIVVIVVITRYFLKVLRFFYKEVESGKLHLAGFYPEWARPTYNLVRIITMAFAFVVIFPHLPGSDSRIFQGVSVFFGLLISLGSSSAISNIIAGLVITYMRAFKTGDRVKIGETTGDVIEKTMLVTKIRTIKNEDISIPNASILSGSTINYSSSAAELGLVLHTTVTIGYDVPWRKVHELLKGAAADTQGIRSEPEPFVLQTSLDDYFVSYEINAYTGDAERAARIYSELHEHIQDRFNNEGIEILSPAYRAIRDGNQGKRDDD